jgi:hypothetical protein
MEWDLIGGVGSRGSRGKGEIADAVGVSVSVG